jgi:hypothetical protein
LGCTLCCAYRGRLVLAGPGAIWYMSRILDPADWDYGYDPNDPARAIAGTSTTTGGIPDQILALMPHSDNYLIFGCERSLWLLTGDPAYGGQITALSREVGVLGPGAWCNLPDGSLVILSRDGLYQIPPGGRGNPEALSRPVLPEELVNLDWTANTLTLCQDTEARGLHLAVTPTAGTTGTHYFLDVTAGSFWPVVLPDTMQPTAMLSYAPDATDPTEVILGGHDGYLRKYDDSLLAGSGANAVWTQGTGVDADGGVLTPATSPAWEVDALAGYTFTVTIGGTATTLTCYSNTATAAKMTTAGPASSNYATWSTSGNDDGTAIAAEVVYGPLRIGGPGRNGLLTQIAADLDIDGAAVQWGVFSGDTAQAAVEAAVDATAVTDAIWDGLWVGGMNRRDSLRASGGALAIMLAGTAGWAVEGLRVEGRDGGLLR